MNVPQPVLVEVDERGWPVVVEDDCSLSQPRRIEEIIETWRIDDEWWRTLVSRRYVDVVLEGGGHMMLFEDLTTGQWFMQMP